MNKWIGSGKVIKDPTIRYKEDKASFVAFTMMCKRNRKIKDAARRSILSTVFVPAILPNWRASI